MTPSRLAALLLATACTVAAADADLASAMALLKAKRFPEARDVLQAVVAREPGNAEAWHELGLVWQARHDTAAYEEAAECFRKAVELAPANAGFLADFGGVRLELADRTRSISAANEGRAALEKAVRMDPSNLDAREGLFQYYLRAPFIVGGSKSKADAQLAEIRRRDPERAMALEVLAKASMKDYAGAFRVCDEAISRNPNDYTALYQYGRTASVSGQNLQRGAECLRKALTIEPPHPASPTHSNLWYRLGDIEEKLGHTDEARAAYESALKLDPANRQAQSGLQKLPSR
jgi:tetratricopeptide (TPR) repeat protein